MPSWLSGGLTVTAVGMGVVILTLVLLSELIAALGRLAGPRAGGNGHPAFLEAGRASGPVPRDVPDGPWRAEVPPVTRRHPGGGRVGDGDGGDGRRGVPEGSRLAAVAAAIAAYLEAEAARASQRGERGRTAASPFRIRSVELLGPEAGPPGAAGTAGPAGPAAGGAAWTRAGRMELMLGRQEIGMRRVRPRR